VFAFQRSSRCITNYSNFTSTAACIEKNNSTNVEATHEEITIRIVLGITFDCCFGDIAILLFKIGVDRFTDGILNQINDIIGRDIIG
jgi:hypothetical protein